MAMRTYGLSGSGMDVDQLVKDLMKARRATYDKVWQQKTQTEWKKKDYNTIYTLVEDLRNKTLSDFKKQSTLSPKQVASTNDAVVSATANGQAVNVEHSIAVSQLADGVKMTSSAAITPAGNYKGSLKTQFGIDPNVTPSLDLKLNGKDISIAVTDTTTLNDVVTQINQSGAGVKASYDATLDRFFLYSENTGATSKINFSGTSDTGMNFLFDTLKLGNFSTGLSSLGMVSRNTVPASTTTLASLGLTGNLTFKVTTDGAEATTVPIDSTTGTVQDVLDAIDARLGTGAATYDTTTKRITIKSVDINHAYTLDGADAASKAFLTDTLGMTQLVQNGHDAEVTLDGVNLAQASNTFTISGVTYNLKSKSLTDPIDGLMPVSITVKADIEKTIDTVQSFVDTYNALITTINNELNEDRNRDYMPLTDAQKADMKDSDITTYTNLAKSGILRNDSTLTTMLNNLRLDFSNPVKGLVGKYNSASSIGIETGKYVDDDGNISSEASNGGKVYVDEDELRAALEVDPDVVYKIFGTSSDSKDSKGVAGRLYDQLYDTMSQLKTVGGYPNAVDTQSILAKQLTDYSERLSAMNDQLSTIQERYYKQFDAMENAISKMNQQSSWLSQQLGQ